MAITNQEIAKFAKFAVEYASKPTYNATPERAARLRKECELAAISYYAKAQQDIRDSGYRVSQRVKDTLWKTLIEIRDRQLAPVVLTREAVTTIAMTTGGERIHPVVVMAGNRMRWVGFGWFNEGIADEKDITDYPLVVEY